MRIGLYLMNQKGFSTLKSLVDKFSDNIGYVVSSRDVAVQNDYYDDIKQTSLKHNIPFYTRGEEVPALIDYKIAIGWRWLIKDSEHLIVLHDSLLPKYRGFAPLVTALLKGDTEIGVTAIWAEKEFDAGGIIFQEKIEILYPIKICEAIEAISTLYGSICGKIFSTIRANQRLSSIPQDEAEATFSIWRDSTDYFIDWSKPAVFVKRFIDALGFPYTGAQTFVEDQLIFVDDAVVEKDIKFEFRQPGKVLKFINGEPLVICGEGMLLIKKMRRGSGEEFSLKKLRTKFK